jgi:ribonuclease D
VARERDVASFRVLNNDVLVDVAREMPEGLDELERVGRISKGNVSRWGDALLAGVDRARSLPEGELPERPRPTRGPPRDPEVDRRTDKLKAVRAAAAQKLQLEPGFLMPRWQLEEIARAEPRGTEELAAMNSVRQWQIEALGDLLLDALND